MEPRDLSAELWREYTIFDNSGFSHDYKINDPVTLWIGKTTHRILDASGIVHCVPAVGVNATTLRWKPRDPNNPVQF